MRFPGTLKTWNDERGFGFIEPSEGGQEVFVHIKAFGRLTERPQPGQALTFEVEPGPQGKKRAVRVQIHEARRTPHAGRHGASTAQWGTATLFALPAFALLLVALNLWGTAPRWLPGFYGLASAVTFLAYALDKSAARRGSWRTAESTLHLLALAGGWPGALLAQQLLRHKSAKAAFRAVFWATVVLNVVVCVALTSPLARLLSRV